MTEGLSLKQMQGSSVQTALFKAVEHGNDEFLRQLFTANILALGIYDENAKSMFQFSIECRQEKVYNFFHEFLHIMNVRAESRVDKFNNTLLHSAARLSPPAQLKHIQCAALQMQTELQWFKVRISSSIYIYIYIYIYVYVYMCVCVCVCVYCFLINKFNFTILLIKFQVRLS